MSLPESARKIAERVATRYAREMTSTTGMKGSLSEKAKKYRDKALDNIEGVPEKFWGAQERKLYTEAVRGSKAPSLPMEDTDEEIEV